MERQVKFNKILPSTFHAVLNKPLMFPQAVPQFLVVPKLITNPTLKPQSVKSQVTPRRPLVARRRSYAIRSNFFVFISRRKLFLLSFLQKTFFIVNIDTTARVILQLDW